MEDLYDLCGRSLQTIPQVMFSVEDVILRITQAAIVGIQLQHREANRSILRFLDCLLRVRRVLRWRGGLERIDGFCLLADCCQIEWSEEIGLERAGLNGE